MVGIALASGIQIALFVVLLLAALGASLADYYTTVVGLQHGGFEGNPLMRWLFSKVGESFAEWLSMVLILFVAGIIANFTIVGALVYSALIAGGEGTQAYLNYRKLKAAGISLK